ncbi:MAG: sugar kinase [Moorellaceae bacterium]
MPDVVTVGEILVEVMAKHVGQDFLSPGELLGPFPSGAPAIFIDQVARLGVSAGIIGKVGADEFGTLNINRLKADGVDTSQIIVTPAFTTGTAFVTYLPGGGRKFIFHFTHSAAGQLGPEEVKEEYIAGARFLHIMGCSLLASASMQQAILQALRVARRNGVKISFDPNVRKELLGYDTMKMIYDQVLSSCDILLSGEEEALAITGQDRLDKAVQIIQKQGASVIVIKKGRDGAELYHGSEFHRVGPVKVEEVDPTGAGDCFDGAFIASLAKGRSLPEALTLANAAGALSVTRKGPMEGAAWEKEILEFMEQKFTGQKSMTQE